MLAQIRAFFRRLLITLIERVPLFAYILSYVGGIILFGLAYYLLTPSANGLIQSGTQPGPINLGTALYFSIITICTVGYGDLVPIGFARFLACSESMFGIAMVGIILAKLT